MSKIKNKVLSITLGLTVMFSSIMGPCIPVKAEETPAMATERALYEEMTPAKAQRDRGMVGYWESIGRDDCVAVFNITEKNINTYTHIGRPGDATTFENVFPAFDMIRRANQLRAEENVEALMVDDLAMAYGELCANYSDSTSEHADVGGWGENLGGGNGYSDPFLGWYYYEKPMYEKGDLAINHTGHYQILTNKLYPCIVTGFGVCSYGTKSSPYTYLQIFGCIPKEQMCTIDEYEARIRAYLAPLDEKINAFNEYINENGHSSVHFVAHHDATCEDNAYDEYVCDVCGTEIRKNTVEYSALKHDYELIEHEDPPVSCPTKFDEQGNPVRDPDGYVMDKTVYTGLDYGYELYRCRRCGKEKRTDVCPEHDWQKVITKEAECETEGSCHYKCSKCLLENPEEPIAPTGHKHLNSRTSKEATCTEDGIKEIYCEDCGKTLRTEPLTMLGHQKMASPDNRPATCTEDGCTGKTICRRCRKTLDEGTVLPATGHNYIDCYFENDNDSMLDFVDAYGWSLFHEVDDMGHTSKHATCSSEGVIWKHCTNGGVHCDHDTGTVLPIDPENHSDLVLISQTQPSCTETGIRHYHCNGCGKDIDVPYGEKQGHDYRLKKTVTPKCNSEGYKTYACSRCGDTYNESLGYGDHSYSDYEVYPRLWTVVKKATCTEPGIRRTSCNWGCGTTHDEEIPINPSAHEYVTETKNATCTEDGYINRRYCKYCGKIVSEGTTVPKKDHDYRETETKPATCTEDGYVKYTCVRDGCGDTYTEPIPAKGHTGGTATCTSKAVCTRCMQEYGETDPANHVHTETRDARTPTCITSGYSGDTWCTDCDTKIMDGTTIPGTGIHDWDDGEITTPSTCTGEGVLTYHCRNCSETKTEEIPLKDHVPVNVPGKPATCTESGYKAYSYCNECHCEIIEKEEIPPLRHIGGTATCTGKAVCERCGQEYGETAPSNHVHTETRNVLEATCTTAGYSGDVWCLDCNKCIEEGHATDPTGKHDWDKGVETKEATCTEKGVMTYHCRNCTETKTEDIPLKEHQIIQVPEKPATCTEDGYNAYSYCDVCKQEIVKKTVIPKKGHIGGTATCMEKAVCTRCGKEYGETDPANHVHTEIRNKTAVTCETDGYTGDTWCTDCNTKINTGSIIVHKGHDWDPGTITKSPTCTSTGIKIHKCKNCTQTETESIPMEAHIPIVTGTKAATCGTAGYTGDTICKTCGSLIEKGSLTNATGKHSYTSSVSGTKKTYICSDCGYSYTETLPASDIEYISNVIVKQTTDSDISGSVFSKTCARVSAVSTNYITIKWTGVSGATAYRIYASQCNTSSKKYPMKLIKTASSGTRSYKYTGLKKGTYYKFAVVALKGSSVLSTSKTMHIATSGGKYTNVKSLTLNLSSVSVKKGKTKAVKVKTTTLFKKGATNSKHRSVKFESSNKKIASVSSKGSVKGIKKGTCYVYVYAQDGIYKKLKVTVK